MGFIIQVHRTDPTSTRCTPHCKIQLCLPQSHRSFIPVHPQFIPNTHLSQRIINKNIQKSRWKSIMGPSTHNYCLFIKIFARWYLKVMTSIWLIISFRIISKHFKMYITINDVIGEKMIDLSYSIYPKKEITVVSMLGNNSQILLQKSMEVLLYMDKKIAVNKGVYMDKELDSLIGAELKSQILDSRDNILRTNKLKKLPRWSLA